MRKVIINFLVRCLMSMISFSNVCNEAKALFGVDVNLIKMQGSPKSKQERRVHILLENLLAMVNEVAASKERVTAFDLPALRRFTRDLGGFVKTPEDMRLLQTLADRLPLLSGVDEKEPIEIKESPLIEMKDAHKEIQAAASKQINEPDAEIEGMLQKLEINEPADVEIEGILKPKPVRIHEPADVEIEGIQKPKPVRIHEPADVEIEGISKKIPRWIVTWLRQHAPELSYDYFLSRCGKKNPQEMSKAFELLREAEKGISDKGLLILAYHYVGFVHGDYILKNLPKLRDNLCPCPGTVHAKAAFEAIPGAEEKKILGFSDAEDDFCLYFKKKQEVEGTLLQNWLALGQVLKDNSLLVAEEFRPYLALINYKVMCTYEDEIMKHPLTPGEIARYFEARSFVSAHRDDPKLEEVVKEGELQFPEEAFRKIVEHARVQGEDEVFPFLKEGQGALRYSPSGKVLVITLREKGKARNIQIYPGNIQEFVLEKELIKVKNS
jgi:hypothetical protein